MPRSSKKMFGKPTVSEILHAEQEVDNAVDKFAVKVVQNNETVRHLPCKHSQILWYFIKRGGKICFKVSGRRRHSKHLCPGTEIPCTLVFSCLRKVKINCLKEQHLPKNMRHKQLLQEPPLMKKSSNNSNKLKVSFMFISGHLKKFYEY